jgi:hypothetical protein
MQWWTNDWDSEPNNNELLVMWGVLAQIKMAQGKIYQWDLLSQWVRRLLSSDSLLSVDIYELLDWGGNRAKVLKSYMQRLEVDINEHEILYEKLFYDAQEMLGEARICLQDKTNADARYFTSVWNRSLRELQGWLKESLKATECYGKKRVEGLAYDYVAQHLALHLQLLKRRLVILERHEDMIIEYYPLLQGNILSQLAEVKQQLEVVRAISPQQLNAYFNRWITDNMQTPQLINVWFRNTQPPNYILPRMQ